MNIKVGDIVAFNKTKNVTWFEVLKIEGHILTIREENTDYAVQFIDKSLVKQIRRS